ncbi:MAG TPA: PepSY-associated TM helix domain-containing protein [Candidatus Cybelea sp.]|nr:PepSY-associated TM helix domain-containing protein [Candidatus Cybelea sp.]
MTHGSLSGADPSLVRTRRLLLLVHQYTGFIFAAYLIVVCASGAILVLLENQITGYRDYAMRRVPVGERKVPLEHMIASVEGANPGKKVYHILESCPAGCTYDVSLHSGTDRLDALVDPYTGAILESVVWNTTSVGILYALHGSLFLGDTGEAINAVAGLSLVILGSTGLFLWPGWQRLRNGFAIKWRGSPYRISYDVHKVTGVAAVTFLLVWAATAAGQVFWPEPPEPIYALSNGQRALSLDYLVRVADAALPGELTFVSMPSSGTIVARKRVPGDPDPYGYSYVAVDARTGAVTQVYDLRTFPLLWRMRAAMYAVHIGAPGGIGLRLAYAIVGFAPALLFSTAFVMWLQKLKR